MRRRGTDARGARNDVHGRRADEARDEQVDGPVVEFERSPRLLDQPVLHHDDLVGHGHGLDLVVGDVDRRGLQALVQLLDLGAHLDAQLRVEIGQRLVEQEHLRIADDRAAHRHALPLAAGQLPRVTVEIGSQPQDVRGLLHVRVDVGLGVLGQRQRERHVLAHRHVRVQRVVLEDHRDVAFLRRHAVHDVVPDRDLAVGDFLQAGDHPQQRGLAAAGRPDEHAELAVGDRDVDATDHVGRTEPLLDAGDLHRGHGTPPKPVLVSRRAPRAIRAAWHCIRGVELRARASPGSRRIRACRSQAT